MAHLGKPKETRKGTAYPVRWRDPDGRFREKWVYGKKTALAEKAKVESDLARGTYVDDRLGKTPLADVTVEWLASLNSATDRTVREYRRLLDSRVLPHFGHRRAVGTIRRTDCDGFVRALRTEGLRPQTIRRAWHPLQAVLAYAAAEGYLPRSPAVNVKLPTEKTLRMTRFKGRRLTWPEVERIATASPPGGDLIVRLLATSGLRPAELAGLNIGDVAILGSNASLRVERTRTLTKGQGWVVSEPKTENSRRTVPVRVPAVVADLATYLAGHPRRSEPDAPVFFGRQPTGLHLPDPERPWDYGTFRRRVFDPAVKEVELGSVRLYDLRGTACSLWASAGVDIFTASRRLGHASVAVTERHYADLFPSDAAADAEAAALATLFAEQRAAVAPVVPLRAEGLARG